MKIWIFVTFAILTLFAWGIQAQTVSVPTADQAALQNAALDYIDGWYEGSTTNERARHPELAKRIIRTDERRRS